MTDDSLPGSAWTAALLLSSSRSAHSLHITSLLCNASAGKSWADSSDSTHEAGARPRGPGRPPRDGNTTCLISCVRRISNAGLGRARAGPRVVGGGGHRITGHQRRVGLVHIIFPTVRICLAALAADWLSCGSAVGFNISNALSTRPPARFLNHHLGSLDPNDVSGHDVSGLLEGLRLEHGPADLAGQAVPSKPRQHQASTGAYAHC